MHDPVSFTIPANTTDTEELKILRCHSVAERFLRNARFYRLPDDTVVQAVTRGDGIWHLYELNDEGEPLTLANHWVAFLDGVINRVAFRRYRIDGRWRRLGKAHPMQWTVSDLVEVQEAD